MITLFPHQREAIENIKPGSILVGGVGSGKSITSLAYFFEKICGGVVHEPHKDYKPMVNPIPLYVITTARKRDTLDWQHDCSHILGLSITKVDSWNNIQKYINIKDAFFIFDEQRLIGSGTWVKSFLKIAKNNKWILLSATPADTWLDYIPVFIANGFYKNRTEFKTRHVVYNNYSKFPKVERYLEVGRLIKLRDSILIKMQFARKTIPHNIDVLCDFDLDKQNIIMNRRWNIFEEKPINDVSQMVYLLRRVVNSDDSRKKELYKIYLKHKKVIVFYNFNYELNILRQFAEDNNISYSEWNGQKHELINTTNEWLYLVQYTAGAEGWNAIETNTIVFYSQNYSYRIMVQSAGRIDRLNTPFIDLYYYHFISKSVIDKMIRNSLKNKKSFNEKKWISKF